MLALSLPCQRHMSSLRLLHTQTLFSSVCRSFSHQSSVVQSSGLDGGIRVRVDDLFAKVVSLRWSSAEIQSYRVVCVHPFRRDKHLLLIRHGCSACLPRSCSPTLKVEVTHDGAQNAKRPRSNWGWPQDSIDNDVAGTRPDVLRRVFHFLNVSQSRKSISTLS